MSTIVSLFQSLWLPIRTFVIAGTLFAASACAQDPATPTTLSTDTKAAEQYELVKGRDVEVCEAYKKNLDRYATLPRFLACGGRFYQSNKEGIAEPNWKQLDFKNNFALYEKAQMYHLKIRAEDYAWPNEETDGYRKLVKDQVNRTNIQIWLVKFDLDGDGVPENVLMTKELADCFSSPETKEQYLIESRKLGVDPERLVREAGGKSV